MGGCCEAFAKTILVILNIIFFILGAGILGVGIWFKVDKSNLFEMMRKIKLDDTVDSFSATNSSALNILAILLIVMGAFTFVTGFCGCCGAINESKCLLYTYAFLVAVVVIVELSLGIYAAVEKTKFENKIKGSLTNALKQNFNGLAATTPNIFTMLFSALMIEGKCCGINNITDFKDTVKEWRHDFQGLKVITPIGCCQFKNNFKLNPDKKVNPDELKVNLIDPMCPFIKYSAKMNSQGCVDSLESAIKENIVVIVGICFGIGLFEILCIIFACCVARKD